MAHLSFNESINSNLTFKTENSEENEEMLKKALNLRYTWSIWEQIMKSSDKSAAYSDAMHKVASFATVQSFWKLWNHMPQPSELLEQRRMVREQPDGGLHVIDAIMIFRENIRPEWEDKLNSEGGHFQFQLKPSTGGGQIDEYWNNLVLGMIGATIEPANMITGLRLVDKLSGPRAANSIRLEVWFSNYEDSSAVQTLRRNVEKCMATRLDGSPGSPPKCETKAHHQPAAAGAGGEPFAGPASAEEMGDWDLKGRRKWLWMHDGTRVTGWIVFGANGTLDISFNRLSGTRTWSLKSNGEMVITFGTCHHICALEPSRPGEPASFVVLQRRLRDGYTPPPVRFQTRGQLDMTGDHAVAVREAVR